MSGLAVTHHDKCTNSEKAKMKYKHCPMRKP
jgi:hypothetical protein